MSTRDRFPYESATVLNQDLLNSSHDNLTCKLEAGVEITAPDGSIIRASDRNKYIGGDFYEALTNFPDIKRSVGEWLGGGLEFPELTIEISNADGRFNKFLPGGSDFAGWIGRQVRLRVGLGEAASTYFTVFNGKVSEVGGFGRTVKSIVIRARDNLETVNKSFPVAVFDDVTFNKADDSLWGKKIPLIYGDWTTQVTPGGASVPALVTNGLDPIVNGRELNCTVSGAVFTFNNHRLNVGDVLEITQSTAPGISASATAQTVSAVAVNEFQLTGVSSSGSGQVSVKKHSTQSFRPVTATIAVNNLTFLGTVFLLRQEKFYQVPSGLVTAGSGLKNVTIAQDNSSFQIDSSNWLFDTGDLFYVLCKGKDLGAYDDNIIEQAKDILKTFGGVTDSDFDTSWATYRDKSTPSQSAVASIKSRVWIQEEQNAMEYALSMLEQVRLEPFVNRSLKFDLNSLHFEDWPAVPSYVVQNWDLEKGKFEPRIDERNNFNRSGGVYGFLPILSENGFRTATFRNNAAISQAGKEISKFVVFPNLYVRAQVEDQVKEVLKLASAYREEIFCNLTFRALLQDIGDFVRLEVDISAAKFLAVPCMIRDVGYQPGTLNLSFRFWSMAMVPFGSYNPGNTGTVGGQFATITKET
jgi:hypothetical protein